MRTSLTLVASLLILAACGPTTPTTAPELPAAPSTEPVVIPASPLPGSNPTTADIQPIPTSTSPTDLKEPIWLQVLSPLDEAVLNTPQVEVIGSAPPGAVVSVNDEIIIVDEKGQFSATISLEEGPNLIEIIASNASGDETSLLLTIVYEP